MALGETVCENGNPENISLFGYNFPVDNSLASTFGYICFNPIDSTIITNFAERAIDRLAEQFK